jgi:cell division protein FtsQ
MTRDTRPRRRGWGGAATLMVIAMAAGGWAVAASPLFHVRDVRVEGVRHLSAPEVVRLAAIERHANLLTLPAERVQRALARNPWIRSADVQRSLPSTLVVTIEERAPVAWVGLPKGVAVVAADGVVLDRRGQPPRGLVGIGSSNRALAPGARLEGFDEHLALAASMKPGLRRGVERASMARGETTLRLKDGTRVRYGDTRSLAAKNSALARVLRWARQQELRLAYVDLSVAGNPAVRVRGA